MRPWDFKYVMFRALNNKDLDSKARPGYRFDLPNLPGIDLIVARRDDPLMSSVVTAPYWDQWGVFDEASGIYIGVCARSRNPCYEAAVKELEHDTPESYAIRINMLHCKRITTILTGGMK